MTEIEGLLDVRVEPCCQLAIFGQTDAVFVNVPKMSAHVRKNSFKIVDGLWVGGQGQTMRSVDRMTGISKRNGRNIWRSVPCFGAREEV